MSIHSSNWPDGVNRTSPNWTGRVQRTSDWGGAWATDSHRIPKSAWIGAALVVAIFAALAFIGHGAGLQ